MANISIRYQIAQKVRSWRLKRKYTLKDLVDKTSINYHTLLRVSGVVFHIMEMPTIGVVGIIAGLACISFALYSTLEPSTKLENVEQSFQSNAKEYY